MAKMPARYREMKADTFAPNATVRADYPSRCDAREMEISLENMKNILKNVFLHVIAQIEY